MQAIDKKAVIRINHELFYKARVKEVTGLLQVSDRLLAGDLSRVLNEVQRTFKEAMVKEVTGLLHISDRLLAGELSRVEAARGTLQPLPIE